MIETEKKLLALMTTLEAQNKLIEAQAEQLQNLTKAVSLLQEREKELMLLVNEKSARIEELLKEIYCAKSEKRPAIDRNQSARSITPSPKRKDSKKKGNKFQMPKGLPEEIIDIDLFDFEKTDPDSGEIFPVLAEERKEILVKTVTYKKITMVRKVYAGGAKYGILRAAWPEQVLNQSSMDASLKADIIISRCLEHQPFNRQVENFQRDGFKTTRQTVNQSFIDIAFELEPLYKLLQKDILAMNVVHADETFLKQQAKGKANGKLKDCYMWFLCARAKEIAHATLPAQQSGQDCVLPDRSLIYIEFADNRRHENAENIIKDFRGKLHSDCYEAYEKMARSGQVTWQACLTHARRKFIKAPDTPLNKRIIKIMSKIIDGDNKLWEFDPEKRLCKRQSQIKPLTKDLMELLEQKKDESSVQVCKKTAEAFNYFLSRKENFLSFLDDPELMVDNNLAERAIRPIKVGLRNWLFIGSARGGQAAAIMYSLVLTCKNIGVDPKAWLTDVIRNFPYTPEEELSSLLPQNWTPQVNPKSEYLPAKYCG
jgi:transposase